MTTIYLMTPGATFKVHGNYLKVYEEQEQRICVPIRNISQFINIGNIHLPKELIKIIKLSEIPVLYLTESSEYMGRLENPEQVQAKYLTYQQRRARDVEANYATAGSMVWARIHNQHTCLQIWTQYYADYTTERALNYLTLLMDNLPLAPSLNDLHEFVEEADKFYYNAITSLLSFHNHCPRTTVKQFNTLFNLGNQLLHQYIYTHLITAGLHPNYPIFHNGADYELPLAWDFVAEFQAPIVHDLVLNFVRNLPSFNGNGKKPRTIMQKFLQSWEGKLKTFVLHPFAGEVSYRQCIQLQVQEYVASLFGNVEYYRPLAFKFHPNHSSFANNTQTQKPALTLVK